MRQIPGFSDRQTPAAGQIFLDHVGWFIPDMDAAAAAFERLGFVLTPLVVSRNADPAGGPPRVAGTANRCAMLPLGYLELITAVPGVETALAQQLREAVARHVGVHVLAFTVADPEAEAARLRERGFEPQEPVLLRRPITSPEGEDTEARFTVIRVPPGKMAEGRIQTLRQETPDLIWQPQLIARANGIAELRSVLLSVDDPAAVADRYAAFVGRPVTTEAGLRRITLDRGELSFATPKECRTLLGDAAPGTGSMVAVGFIASDLQKTRAFLRGSGVPHRDSGPVSLVPAAEALGAALVIHESGTRWP